MQQSFLHTTIRREFTTDMLPETVANVLERAFSDTHQFLLDDENFDEILFEIVGTDNKGRPDVRLEGALVRWEGTHTRVHLRGEVIVPDGNIWLQRALFFSVMGIVSVVMFGIIQRLFQLQFSFENSFFVCSAVGLLGYAYLWAALTLNKRVFMDHNATRRWEAQQSMAALATQLEQFIEAAAAEEQEREQLTKADDDALTRLLNTEASSEYLPPIDS